VLTRLIGLGLAIAAALAGYAVYELALSRLEGDVYRERLRELDSDYDRLRERYNAAIRRTAVTELVVENGRLSVVIRTADGTLRSIPTALDPALEIYVDFVMLDGRLWIRRVFDERTPPGEGVLVDPRLVAVDWEAPGAAHGKAAYRSLEEGRFVVTVTGDGSLGLSKLKPSDGIELSGPPPMRRHDPLDEQLAAATRRLQPEEILRGLARRVGLLDSPGP